MLADRLQFQLPGTSATTTWNPADKGANIALSGGNLIASNSTTGSDSNVRTIASQSSGKWYVEITASASGTLNGNFGLGVANSTAGLTTFPGGNVNSTAFFIAGSGWFYNSAATGTSSTFTNSDIVSIALDLTNTKVWMRVNGGTWQGSASGGDPALNTSGQPLQVASGPYFFIADTRPTAGTVSWTANFGATSFTYAVPSGFTAGFG
jgi:hypothetical protein